MKGSQRIYFVALIIATPPPPCLALEFMLECGGFVVVGGAAAISHLSGRLLGGMD